MTNNQLLTALEALLPFTETDRLTEELAVRTRQTDRMPCRSAIRNARAAITAAKEAA